MSKGDVRKCVDCILCIYIFFQFKIETRSAMVRLSFLLLRQREL